MGEIKRSNQGLREGGGGGRDAITLLSFTVNHLGLINVGPYFKCESQS